MATMVVIIPGIMKVTIPGIMAATTTGGPTMATDTFTRPDTPTTVSVITVAGIAVGVAGNRSIACEG
jgi:hypothetical protein